MRETADWLQGLGLATLPQVHRIHAIIAGALVLACLALGVFAQRTLGPLATTAWKRAGQRAEGIGSRVPVIIRHFTAALLLAIPSNAYDWPPLAALLIGFALGASTALAAFQVLRGVGIARWIAWPVGLILFVALFSHAVGGLHPITATLERVGFDVGRRRFSLLSLVTVLIVSVALFAAVRLTNRMLAHWISGTNGLDATQKLLAQKLAAIAVIVLAFFLGVDLLDIDLTTFAVFSGALGLAVGFGLQKTVGNLIAGIILLMDRSIKPGDVIVVGQKDVGRVNRIGVRAVSVITRDGKEHLIPNENLMTQEVENWSYTDRNVRVRVAVGVGYACDLRLAQELMLRAANESPRVLKSPKPNVWLSAFGDNAVEHEILVWISDPESGVGNVRSDVLNRLWWLFKEHGIEVPYPQRVVHLQTNDTGFGD
ncbi:MAG: mechanosensitive ion channel domain-containing protein [Sphingomonas sp.]